MNWEAYTQCRLCPRACGVNRLQGERGYCGALAQVELGRAALHAWEEPSISGMHGSGTVFFVHCTLGCIYCQNRQISTRQASGITVDANRLAEIFLELQDQKAQNTNLVTATHYAPHVAVAVTEAKRQGLKIPVLLNCGGFESLETIQMLEGLIDIYLPDLKYYSSYYAQMYSQASDYFETADAAIDMMVRQTGAPVFDAQGNMKRGTLIRHLMLPGLAGDTRQILRHIAERWGDRVLVSLMRQYTPIGMEKYPELNRTITEEEYQDAVTYFTDLGLAGYLQEGEAARESFIPAFCGEGVKRD